MVSVLGTYENGYLTLDKEYLTKTPVKVIVTFLEEIYSKSDDSTLNLDDFSFSESKKNLKDFKGSFSDAVIDERRKEL
jgi:hypothetical protein